jgi:hypothetical protein
MISDIYLDGAVKSRPGAPDAPSILETEGIGRLGTALSAKSSFF